VRFSQVLYDKSMEQRRKGSLLAFSMIDLIIK
jgi:hypothetical protein